MDEEVTRLALRSQEPKIILHGSDEGGAGEEEEYVVELQETVLVSEVEGEAASILDEKKHVNTHDMKKQNETTEKLDIKIVLPSVETEVYNSSESEWEEEAEKLCNWSKQLDIDALETPAFI